MKKFLLPVLLFMAAYGANAQQLRVHCLAELTPTSTRFDTLQYQERFFRKRATPKTTIARYMYFAAEVTARIANAEKSIFDRKTGQSYLPEMASSSQMK